MSWIREHELIQKKAIHEFIIREITSTRTNELKKKQSKWEFCHWRTSNTRKCTVFILFHLFTISFNSIEFRTNTHTVNTRSIHCCWRKKLLWQFYWIVCMVQCVCECGCSLFICICGRCRQEQRRTKKKYNNSINKSILMTFMFVVCGQNSVLASADNSWPAKPRAHKAVTNQREPEQNKKNTKWSEKQVACRQCTETRSPGMSWEPHTNTHEHSLQNWAE